MRKKHVTFVQFSGNRDWLGVKVHIASQIKIQYHSDWAHLKQQQKKRSSSSGGRGDGGGGGGGGGGMPNIALEHNSYYNWTKRAYVWNGRH